MTSLQENVRQSRSDTVSLELLGKATREPSSTSAAAFRPFPRSPHYLRNGLISLGCFGAFLLLGLAKRQFGVPVVEAFNSLARESYTADMMFHFLNDSPSLSGVFLLSLLWYCWFGTQDLAIRSRILAGTCSAFGAGILSRMLQYLLDVHPRPALDPDLDFVLPFQAKEQTLNTWNSFPSDHATVFTGLVVVVMLARPRLGIAAALWMVLVEASRAYTGFHYPSDLLGGAALACAVIWFVQAPGIVRLAGAIARREATSPALFYLCAFFLSYQIATLFGDVRDMAGTFGHLALDVLRGGGAAP